jgi:hypothetical protein
MAGKPIDKVGMTPGERHAATGIAGATSWPGVGRGLGLIRRLDVVPRRFISSLFKIVAL